MQKAKEEIIMMDVIMVAVLAGCVGLVYLLIGWCHKQVDVNE